MLSIGQTILHYSIVSKLGRGGMGEVYRAKDQKLGRDVAIKVLPDEFALDVDRIARFQREAKLLASLNHPNIASIYGLEEYDGTHFLVLELIEGDTLADRIKDGAMPVEEALNLALQIAEALEAAHEKGVIHRDLKPANIKVTTVGKVKVLDFGLAKAYAGNREEVNLSNSPTLSDVATQQGVILGTAAYMSPEQARGRSVDKRADIWAFGCVLYEMLTGQPTWSGETVTDIIAAALAKEPDFSKVPPNLHPRVRELLARCLQKDPMERFRDVGDVRVEIKRFLADPDTALLQPVTTAEPRSSLRMFLTWIAGAIVLGGIITGVAVWNLKRMPQFEPRQVMRFEYDLPEGQQFTNPGIRVVEVSPDGRQFVYNTTKGLYLRSVDELTARLITGTEGPTQQPFFSPDGKWVGYFSVADQKLKKISINGGAPVTLCDVSQLQGARWCEDNTIVYGQFGGDIMRISVNGGTAESLVEAKSSFLSFPQVLPDGQSVLYTSTTGGTDYHISVQSAKDGKSRELFTGDWAQYLPTGHIAYSIPNESNLLVVPFDIDKLELQGGAVPMVQGFLQGAISSSGTLIYLPGSTIADPNDQRTLVWVDRKGKAEPLASPPMFYKYPQISPDGTQLAVTDYATGKIHDIWIWNLARRTLTKLTFEGKDNICPVWSPDGRRIAFLSFGHGSSNASGVYWKSADGAGQDEQIRSTPDKVFVPYCWSRDGESIVGTEMPSSMSSSHIAVLSMEGGREQKTLLQQSLEICPKISPDGRWMAYTSYESGRPEIYVRPFPEVQKGRWQISTSGGGGPLWSPDGGEIFYMNGERVMSVSVRTEPTFDIIGTPQELFRGRFIDPNMAGEGTPWDISPDGKRFLMIKKPEAPTSTGPAPRQKMIIVMNWFEELKQRAPAK